MIVRLRLTNRSVHSVSEWLVPFGEGVGWSLFFDGNKLVWCDSQYQVEHLLKGTAELDHVGHFTDLLGHEAFSFVGSALAWMTEVVVGGLLASHANLLNFL